MSFYDMLLDDLISKSRGKFDREQIDELMTQAADATNKPKWRILLALGQALAAYANFGDSMHKLINDAGHSQEQIEEVSEAIQRLAE